MAMHVGRRRLCILSSSRYVSQVLSLWRPGLVVFFFPWSRSFGRSFEFAVHFIPHWQASGSGSAVAKMPISGPTVLAFFGLNRIFRRLIIHFQWRFGSMLDRCYPISVSERVGPSRRSISDPLSYISPVVRRTCWKSGSCPLHFRIDSGITETNMYQLPIGRRIVAVVGLFCGVKTQESKSFCQFFYFYFHGHVLFL